MSKMQTNVKSTLTSYLRAAKTSPVAIKNSRKKYATAQQLTEHARTMGFSTTSGWMGRILHELVSSNQVSMTTTTINGRTVNVYGLVSR